MRPQIFVMAENMTRIVQNVADTAILPIYAVSHPERNHIFQQRLGVQGVTVLDKLCVFGCLHGSGFLQCCELSSEAKGHTLNYNMKFVSKIQYMGSVRC